MQSHLFKYIFAPAVMLAAAFTTNTSRAATLQVPFDFTVAGKTCPAGLYRVDRSLLLGTGQVTLARVGGSQHFTWMLRPGDPAPTDERVILRFSQAGDTHALTSVQYRSGITAKIHEGSRQVENMAPRGMSGE